MQAKANEKYDASFTIFLKYSEQTENTNMQLNENIKSKNKHASWKKKLLSLTWHFCCDCEIKVKNKKIAFAMNCVKQQVLSIISCKFEK